MACLPEVRLSLRLDHESERRDVIRWMSTVPHNSHHRAIGKGFMIGSEQWLLQENDFDEWRKSSVSSILWLHGIRKFSQPSQPPEHTKNLYSWIRHNQARVCSTSSYSKQMVTFKVIQSSNASPPKINPTLLRRPLHIFIVYAVQLSRNARIQTKSCEAFSNSCLAQVHIF